MLQERVLAFFEQNKNQTVTGGRIARELGVSRNAVWKAVHALIAKGHAIEAKPNSGYRLCSVSDGLSSGAVAGFLSTERFGRRLDVLESVNSTMTYVKEQDTAALPEGYAVLADVQTAGRGRLGRPFSSPAGQGVYLSVLLKPQTALEDVSMLTLCAAVAVSAAVETVSGLSVGIKWVNDIYFGNKKLCGILSEAFISAELNRLEYAVVGIGVNTGAVDPAIADIATSICEAAGLRGIRNRLAAEILNRFEESYRAFQSPAGRQWVLGEYRRRLFIVGRRAEVLQPSGSYAARVLGIDDTGALLVKTDAGETRSLRAGEVRIVL